MSKSKTVVIEKDGVQAEATKESFAALAKRGWTVVEDGDKELSASQGAEAQERVALVEKTNVLFAPEGDNQDEETV
jgi:hypothetical protein